jgi:DNA polymerase elongation subunit (family B)
MQHRHWNDDLRNNVWNLHPEFDNTKVSPDPLRIHLLTNDYSVSSEDEGSCIRLIGVTKKGHSCLLMIPYTAYMYVDYTPMLYLDENEAKSKSVFDAYIFMLHNKLEDVLEKSGQYTIKKLEMYKTGKCFNARCTTRHYGWFKHIELTERVTTAGYQNKTRWVLKISVCSPALIPHLRNAFHSFFIVPDGHHPSLRNSTVSDQVNEFNSKITKTLNNPPKTRPRNSLSNFDKYSRETYYLGDYTRDSLKSKDDKPNAAIFILKLVNILGNKKGYDNKKTINYHDGWFENAFFFGSPEKGKLQLECSTRYLAHSETPVLERNKVKSNNDIDFMDTDNKPSYNINNFKIYETCVYEANIDFTNRFFVDEEINQSSWIEIPKSALSSCTGKKRSVCNMEYFVNDISQIKNDTSDESICPLLEMSWDCETDTNKIGSRYYKKGDKFGPIFMICTHVYWRNVSTNTKSYDVSFYVAKKPCTHMETKSGIAYHFTTFNSMLKAFIQFHQTLDPDVVAGHNINNFDYERLLIDVERYNLRPQQYQYAKKDNENNSNTIQLQCHDQDEEIDDLDMFGEDDNGNNSNTNKNKFIQDVFDGRVLGRMLNEATIIKKQNFNSKAAGNFQMNTVPMAGRIQIDTYLSIKKDVGTQSRYHLDGFSLNACAHKILGETKLDIDYTMISIFYNDGKNDQGTSRLLDYCVKDAQLPAKLIKELNTDVSMILQSRVTAVSANATVTRGSQFSFHMGMLKFFRRPAMNIKRSTGRDVHYIAPSAPHYPKDEAIEGVAEKYKGACVFEPPKNGHYYFSYPNQEVKNAATGKNRRKLVAEETNNDNSSSFSKKKKKKSTLNESNKKYLTFKHEYNKDDLIEYVEIDTILEVLPSEEHKIDNEYITIDNKQIIECSDSLYYEGDEVYAVQYDPNSSQKMYTLVKFTDENQNNLSRFSLKQLIQQYNDVEEDLKWKQKEYEEERKRKDEISNVLKALKKDKVYASFMYGFNEHFQQEHISIMNISNEKPKDQNEYVILTKYQLEHSEKLSIRFIPGKFPETNKFKLVCQDDEDEDDCEEFDLDELLEFYFDELVIRREEEKKRQVSDAALEMNAQGISEGAVVTLDFASLYPSIMIAHNICSTTYITRGQAEECGFSEKDLHPANGMIILPKEGDKDYEGWCARDKSKDGFFVPYCILEGCIPTMLNYLVTERRKVKAQMELLKENISSLLKNLYIRSVEDLTTKRKNESNPRRIFECYEKGDTDNATKLLRESGLYNDEFKDIDEKERICGNLNVLQAKFKINCNASYGALGVATSGRLPWKPAAEAITEYGRKYVTLTDDECCKKFCKKNGYPFDIKSVYGDTDSVFFILIGLTADFAFKYGKEMAKYITEECINIKNYFDSKKYILKLEFEKYFRNLLFFPAGNPESIIKTFSNKQKRLKSKNTDFDKKQSSILSFMNKKTFINPATKNVQTQKEYLKERMDYYGYVEDEGNFYLLGAKKRYMGKQNEGPDRNGEPTIDFPKTRGLELVRRDTPKCQRMLLEILSEGIVIKELPLSETIRRVQEYCTDFIRQKLNLEHYITIKGMNKDPSDYAHPTIVSAVAARFDLKCGSNIPYILTTPPLETKLAKKKTKLKKSDLSKHPLEVIQHGYKIDSVLMYADILRPTISRWLYPSLRSKVKYLVLDKLDSIASSFENVDTSDSKLFIDECYTEGCNNYVLGKKNMQCSECASSQETVEKNRKKYQQGENAKNIQDIENCALICRNCILGTSQQKDLSSSSTTDNKQKKIITKSTRDDTEDNEFLEQMSHACLNIRCSNLYDKAKAVKQKQVISDNMKKIVPVTKNAPSKKN